MTREATTSHRRPREGPPASAERRPRHGIRPGVDAPAEDPQQDRQQQHRGEDREGHDDDVGLAGVGAAFAALGDPERHAKILIDPRSAATEPVAAGAAGA